jgi:hypothetical protein
VHCWRAAPARARQQPSTTGRQPGGGTSMRRACAPSPSVRCLTGSLLTPAADSPESTWGMLSCGSTLSGDIGGVEQVVEHTGEMTVPGCRQAAAAECAPARPDAAGRAGAGRWQPAQSSSRNGDSATCAAWPRAATCCARAQAALRRARPRWRPPAGGGAWRRLWSASCAPSCAWTTASCARARPRLLAPVQPLSSVGKRRGEHVSNAETGTSILIVLRQTAVHSSIILLVCNQHAAQPA